MSDPRKAPIRLDIAYIPAYITYLHKQIVGGNGDEYRETDGGSALTMISPLPIDQTHFPYLKDVEEVWLVYRR